ncbi:MAG: DUF4197 domain-containing protein [Bacteroidales bacterium]|jgi:hypothetical protein|nr:DUF4197 domain-containing protein [Bacteroidales bacterium]
MKKRIYLLLLSVVAIFPSCRDNSGDFVEQLFTDAQISIALRDCLYLASDSTLRTLCVLDEHVPEFGYYLFDILNYRIELPADAKQIIDTLGEYGFVEILDTLIFDINQAAELCGTKLNKELESAIKLLQFPDPKLILHGGKNAATIFFKEKHKEEFISLLVTTVLLEQFNELHIFARWNELQENYFQITGKYSSIDILTPAAQQMLAGYFKLMTLVEEAIRNNPKLRGKSDSLLNKVFETQ